VPWQHLYLLSNSSYTLRMGAINGDNEITPGVYSSTRTFTTPPYTPGALGAVALSSYTIQWQWSTGTFTGTGITGYMVYQSSITADGGKPDAGDLGVPVHYVAGDASSAWTEVYADSGSFVSANSRHTRWIKAVGLLESPGGAPYQKYTYAIAPATCTTVYLDPDPYWVFHVFEKSLNLTWSVRVNASEASSYVVQYTTTADFAVAMSSVIADGNPDTVTGLTGNTKYDLRVGAINGDGEQTPANGLNPFAYSMFYRVITAPHPPSDFAATPYTDTALDYTWSTTTYHNPQYISGYTIAEMLYDQVNKFYYLSAVAFMPGVSSNKYTLDYLITNSTHTRYVWASQSDPDFASDPHYPDPDYRYKGAASSYISATGATFATPPNDLVFDTVTAHTAGMWWKEPEVPATLYQVERSTTIGEKGPWVFVSSTAGSHFNDTGLLPTTTYSYRIGAINQFGVLTTGLSAATSGNRRDYSFVSSTFTLHKAPTLYGVALGTQTIKWWWTDDVPGVQHYNLYTSTDGVIVKNLLASATYWTETGLPGANVRYYRRVRSVTTYGEGDWSDLSVATLANPPASLAVSGSSLHTMSLSWPVNGSTRYRLDRSVDGSSWTAVAAWADDVAASTFTDSRLRYATTYYYSVSGYNEDGILSVSSTAVSGTSRTQDLPAGLLPVYSTSTSAQTLTVPIPGLGQVTVMIPAGGAADGYIYISTDAAANPSSLTKANVDTATNKLLPSKLLSGAVTELFYNDAFGARVTANFASPARITFTYLDANNDGIVDASSPQIAAGALRIFNLDTQALVWNPVTGSTVDTLAKTVYADIPHFSYYALVGYNPLAASLSGAHVYPNPYKPGSGGAFDRSAFGDGVVFEGLPASAEIKVFSMAGALVADLDASDGTGRYLWNARNRSGSRVASGVYFYIITNKADSGDKTTGKLAIIK
jgi:hypothetical protein